jgi:Ca-activated chloride channel family protein
VADAHRVSVPVLEGEHPTEVGFTLAVGDTLTGPATSPSHRIGCTQGVGPTQICLAQEDARLDRDVVVRWPVAVASAGVSALVGRLQGHQDAHALVTVVPPFTPMPAVRRDLILLLDASGSMGGAPMQQLKRFSRALIDSLADGDGLEIISFSSHPTRYAQTSTRVDAQQRSRANTWVSELRARGGTHMHEAIYAALSPLRAESQRQVVLVTDGLIGFEQEIVRRILDRLPEGSRVHTVGVGHGANRALLRPAARAGRGVEVIVSPDEDVAPAVATLLAHTAAPQVVDLHVHGARMLAPCRLPDLFAGAPLRLALAVPCTGSRITLTGRSGSAPVSWTLDLPGVAEGEGQRAVCTRFARERVEDCEMRRAGGADAREVDDEITSLGLAFQISTRLTSWLAMTQEATVDPLAPYKRVHIPHAMPAQMSAAGLGLRPAAPARLRSSGAGAMSMAAPPPQTKKRGAIRRGIFGAAKDAIDGFFQQPSQSMDVQAEEEVQEMASAPPPERMAPLHRPPPRPAGAAPAAPAPLTVQGRILKLYRDAIKIEITPSAHMPWRPVEVWAVFGSRRVRLTLPAHDTRGPTLPGGMTSRISLSGPIANNAPDAIEFVWPNHTIRVAM